MEDVSDYKHRDRLVLVGPPKEDAPPASAPVVPGTPAEQEPAPPAEAAHSSKGVRLFLIMRSTPFQDSF